MDNLCKRNRYGQRPSASVHEPLAQLPRLGRDYRQPLAASAAIVAGRVRALPIGLSALFFFKAASGGDALALLVRQRTGVGRLALSDPWRAALSVDIPSVRRLPFEVAVGRVTPTVLYSSTTSSTAAVLPTPKTSFDTVPEYARPATSCESWPRSTRWDRSPRLKRFPPFGRAGGCAA